MTNRASVRFLQFSDTHISADKRSHLGVDVVSALSQAVQSSEGEYNFMIHTGDIVSRPALVTSYERYRSIVEGMGCPRYHIPGNHDNPEIMASILPGCTTEYPWSLNHEEFRFIGLDTSSGFADARQLERLETLLKIPEQTIIFLHHQICTMDDSWLNPFALENPDAFAKSLRGATARILGIIHGHIHHTAVFEFCGVPVYSAPALSNQFDPYGKFLATTREPAAFAKYTIDPGGVIERTVHLCDREDEESSS